MLQQQSDTLEYLVENKECISLIDISNTMLLILMFAFGRY